MKLNLIARTAIGFGVVLTLMGATIFVCAGTVRYWQAWLFLSVYAACTALITARLWRHDKGLLERRLRGGPFAERERAQKVIMFLASAGFIAAFAIPGLDHRWHWSTVPAGISILGDALIAAGFYAVHLVLRENRFAAATVSIATGQEVISTGPYAVVRHPMYAASTPLFIGIPLALDSYWGLVPVAALVPVLIWRLLDEERFLGRNLPGYEEYRSRVRWRLFPGIF